MSFEYEQERLEKMLEECFESIDMSELFVAEK